MQIVIDIPNKDIPKHQEIIDIPLHFINGKVCEAGEYGFMELPKGHERLGDLDKILKEDCIDYYTEFGCEVKVSAISIDTAPTIIPADKGEE